MIEGLNHSIGNSSGSNFDIYSKNFIMRFIWFDNDDQKQTF